MDVIAANYGDHLDDPFFTAEEIKVSSDLCLLYWLILTSLINYYS